MKISLAEYKGIFAIELQSKDFTTLVLPTEGGKIASFKDAEGEEYLLQNPSKSYGRVGLDDSYVDGECSGFDDMFPTIDSVELVTSSGAKLVYPDHGEVCRVPFSYETTESALVLNYTSPMGYSYKKILSEKDVKLSILCEIANFSQEDLDVLWAGHCLIKAEEGGEVLLPFLCGEPVDVQFDTANEYSIGQRVLLKKEMLVTSYASAPRCHKLYFPNKPQKGFIGYRYKSGKVFSLSFDANTLPVIGVWQNYGVVKGYYCVGLEPCTVGYDTVLNARKYGQSSIIKSGDTLKISLNIFVK